MLPKELQIEVSIPKTPLAECKTFNWFKGEKGDKGDKGDTGNTGATGQDGFSPTVNVAKAGDILTVSITDKNGTTTESLDIGGKADTDLANVSAKIDYIVEYKAPTASDPNWYEVWRSGKVVQGGIVATGSWVTVTLLKPMATNTYTITTGSQIATGDNPGTKVSNPTTTTFQIAMKWDTGQYKSYLNHWRVEGIGA